MKTISLKVPDDVYEKIESYRKRENMNRTSYVMEAVVAYNRKIERDELARKLQAEAKVSAKEYKRFEAEMAEWDTTLLDGLGEEKGSDDK